MWDYSFLSHIVFLYVILLYFSLIDASAGPVNSIGFFSLFQVNEYLKDVVTQEQRKRETPCAEPAGSPRVGVFAFISWKLHMNIQMSPVWLTVSNKLSVNPGLRSMDLPQHSPFDGQILVPDLGCHLNIWIPVSSTALKPLRPDYHRRKSHSDMSELCLLNERENARLPLQHHNEFIYPDNCRKLHSFYLCHNQQISALWSNQSSSHLVRGHPCSGCCPGSLSVT